MEETWTQLYDSETKEQRKEWRYRGSPHPEKFKTEAIKQGASVCLLGQRWNLFVE
jgi:hypothetical protein